MTDVADNSTKKEQEEANSECLICLLLLDVIDTRKPLSAIYDKWKEKFYTERYNGVRKIVEEMLGPEGRPRSYSLP